MKKLFICLLVAVFVFSGDLFATEITAFGPQIYKRTTAEHNVFSDTFSAPETTGRLIIRNGSEDDQHRVTSATVTFNNVVLFTPEDFHHADYLLERPVDLQETNLIRIELASTPETYIEIEIVHDTAYTVAFGPEIFERTNGRPNIYNNSFAAIDIPGRLIVRNGSETGENRVSSGTVTINGIEVFNSSDFKKLDYMMERSVDLAETNILLVELASTPGNYLEIEVLHEAIFPSALLEAEPVIVIKGETSILTWTSENALSCYLTCDPQPDIGEVDLNGTLEVSPDVTTTYTLTANGLGGVETASAMVEVIPLPSVELTAVPETIIQGNTVELSWISENADTVNIDNGIGTVNLNGTVSVSPETTTTYTITATGPGGTATSSSQVTVIPNPILIVAADVFDIIWGESCEISWQAFNADTVTIDNGIGSVPLFGSVMVSPTETKVFTLTAVGPGGTITASVTVNVTIPPPTVTLSVFPNTIIQGEIATLSWTSTFAQTISIDNGLGRVAIAGSMEISPSATTSYTITAAGPGGTASTSVTIEVIPLPTVYITAVPDTIMVGEFIELTWTTAHADTVIGRQVLADGSESEMQLPTSGTSILAPTQTTTYTVIATGPGGEISGNITVTVSYPEPEVSINAQPDTIYKGGTSMLVWNSTHAETLTIDNGLGSVLADGSMEISPPETTIYTITAVGPGGTSTATVTVTVTPAPPEVVFLADPENILPGNSTTLIWNTINADTCEISPGIGAVETDGFFEVIPTETTTYTITVNGPGGETSGEITVKIVDNDLAPIHLDTTQIAIDPQTLEVSGSVLVDVSNDGTTAVEDDFSIILFEDVDRNEEFIPDTDNVMGSARISAGTLAAGSQISITIPIDSATVFRDNRIFALIDARNDVLETNETNNIIHNMADCEFIPPAGEFNPALEWRWSGSEIEPDFNQVMCIPIVANLNDDNNDGQVNINDIPDIIFHSWNGNLGWDQGILRAISGDGSGELFSVTDESYRTLARTSPAVGDLDNDGLPEIIAIGLDYYLYCFENDGTFKWKSDYLFSGTSLRVIACINLADLNEDGSPEVIVGSMVYSNKGQFMWKGRPGVGRYNSCVADLDLDGHPELICGNTAYRSNKEIYWQNTMVGDGYTAVGNFDVDPFPEIVVVYPGYVYLLEHNGDLIWKTKLLDILKGGPPTVADFDNDGLPEIGVADSGHYEVFETDGTLKWAKVTQDVSSGQTGSSVFDFDGDGSAEVVYADENRLRIYRGTDGVVLFKYVVGSWTSLELPVIADVDNDNNAEIVVVANKYGKIDNHGILVFGDTNDTWVNTRKIWNQHAYSITNINDDATIPRYMANNWETFNSFRQNEMLNPFGCTDLSASFLRSGRTSLPVSIDLIGRVGNGGALHVVPGVKVSFYDGDPDAGGLLLGVTQTANRIYPGEYEDVTITWNNPVVDLHDIYMRVDDDGTGRDLISESNETNNTVQAIINTGNTSPVADAGASSTVFIDDPVYLDGSGSYDPEGHPLTYAWSIITQPEGSQCVLADEATVAPSFIPDIVGNFILQLVVNDGLLDSGISQITILAGPEISVPDLVGFYQTDAQLALEATYLTTGDITQAYSSQVPEGCVISQNPVADTIVVINTPVDLTVSLGVQKVTVPDLTGLQPDAAEALLTSAALTSGNIIEDYSDVVPAGQIFDQNPYPGDKVAENTAVNMHVSLGIWTGEDTDPPYVRLTVNPERIDPGEKTTFTLFASDNVGVVERALTIDGTLVNLTGNTVEYEPQGYGLIVAEATATDAAGLTGTDSVNLYVTNPYDDVPPTAVLDETDCPDVTDLYSVYGTVSDLSGFTYTLAARMQGDTEWQTFAQGSGIQISGRLGVFDPSIRPNGVYEIRLYAQDMAGNVTTDYGCALVDGSLKLGAVILPNSDLSIPAPGMPVALERTYDSRIKDGDFGKGWQLPSSAVKPMTTRALSKGWAEEVGGSFFTTYYLIEKYRHVVVIRFSDEEVLKFKMDVTPKSSVLLPYSGLNLRAAYVPLDDTQGTLVALNAASDHLMMINNELLEYGTDPYEPVRFKLTRPDGTVYIVNKNTGLESMTDVYGHTVTYDEDGISHSSGVSLSFSRDMDNRIETVTDSFGRTVTYQYDQNGMLEKAVQSTTVNPYLHRYVYEMGTRLEAIKAPDGTRLGTFEYDYAGRLTALIDADGNRIIYGHDIESHTQEISDRLGRTSLYEYDSKGNVTYKLDADGRESFWTYDDHGNKLSETDPAGLTKTYTYDDNDNMLSETDPMGHTTSYTYNERNDVLTTIDPMGNVTENTYDVNGDLLTTTDALDNVTEHTYDTDGNLTSTKDALGNITQYEYDASGNRTKEIDPEGNQTLYTFDNYGNELTETTTRMVDGVPVTMTTTKEYDNYNKVTKTIDPYGNETFTEYNYKVDKESATVDKNGARTEFLYDGKGNLTQTLFADGSSAINTYDAEGNRLSSTDRNGRVTEFDYDSADRLVRTDFEDGTYTEMEYDDAGRLIASIDERANRTEFVYDDAGRRTQVIDALGKTTHFDYDDNGNQIFMTDANGHTTEYVYDELNRRVKTIFHDATFTETAYDAKGNKISETDQNGRTTQFEYDANGNLTAVVDVDGNRSEYSYDEVGNKLTFKDANNHIESWKYDDLGRVIKHTLPLGMYETFTYDPNGNTKTHTDFNGQTISYDYSVCCNRLEAAHYPNGTSTTYTYLPGGQRDSVADSSGTTQYYYDVRGRLEQVTNPDGSIIAYTYDAAGNRSSVDIPSGAVDYTFDALNRLETVTDADGGVTTYTYDDVGNRASVTYPNGVLTTYTYDDLNRLISMETANSSAVIINSYIYTLDNAGNRTRVQENNGRIVDYNYDNLYRLTAEDIVDPVNGNQSISYSYDAVGNRLSKTVDGAVTSYIYDINNRLTSETTSGDTIIYGYDNNGNQIQKLSSTEDIAYGYNYENRLVSVDDSTSLILYEYDVDGIKTRKSVDGTVTKYLVDKNRDYAQVLEEIDGTGTLMVSYVYGDDLISQNRSGTASYFHYDGIGSTRALTDELGDATDTYNYEAFGNSLNQTGSTINVYLFTGEQYDPNLGFYYLRARWLNPDVDRFLTVDPFEGVQNDPVSLHKYLYASANPVMYVDPSGEFGIAMFSFGSLSDSYKREKNAEKVLKGYKNVRKGLCVAAATTMRHSHHAVPMFMGGHRSFSKNPKVVLPKNFHIEFHRLLHYMLRMADLPGGNTSYKALFEKNPATREAAHNILILACRIFDNRCKSKVGYPITPIIRKQIEKGDWDF